MHTFWFIVLSLVLTQIARRVGWVLSKRVLYVAPLPLLVLTCITWGGAIAVGVHALVSWLTPHWVVKWIFGFAQGAYAAVPNYGLYADATIPPHAERRHQLIYFLPVAIYLVVLIGLELRSAA